MEKINTYGIKMVNLKEASDATLGLHDNLNVQISYNMESGEFYWDTHIGDNEWTTYRNKKVVTVCYAYHYYPPQRIADELCCEYFPKRFPANYRSPWAWYLGCSESLAQYNRKI